MSEPTVLFPAPCHEDWERMRPDGRASFCARCAKPVHDLTHYTPEEAEQLLIADETPACVRASVLSDGQVLTRPSRTGWILTAAVMAPALAAALASCTVADTSTGSIVGSIQTYADRVTVTAFGAGTQRSIRVDQTGGYHLDGLPPGSYRLVFSVAHAQTWMLNDVPVTAGAITLRNSRDPLMPTPPPVVLMGRPVAGHGMNNVTSPSTPTSANATPVTAPSTKPLP